MKKFLLISLLLIGGMTFATAQKNAEIKFDKTVHNNYRTVVGTFFEFDPQKLSNILFLCKLVVEKLEPVYFLILRDTAHYAHCTDRDYDKYKDIIVENLPNANIITSDDGEEGDMEKSE